MEIRLKKKRGKDWPLKDEPLRNPGQSLDEQIADLIDTAVMWTIAVGIFGTATLFRWIDWYAPPPWPPQKPIFLTVIFGAIFACAWWKAHRIMKKVRRVKLGRAGEKAVGQELEKLRERGYRVFHDILADKFNVDHVIIGPGGIFAVETKTRSVPRGKRAEVRFDGQKLTCNDKTMDRDPIKQAKAQAVWIHDILEESTGRSYFVKPVLVFPGWWVAPTENNLYDLWVLNPKALPIFIEKEPKKLSDEDIKLAAYHLSRYIRASERYARIRL